MEESPSVPEKPVSVVAAVIRQQDRFLLCQRPDHKRHGGMWEFPGGKLHDGEDYEAAVRRELSEELALTVESVGEVLAAIADPDSEFVIHFLPVVASGQAQSEEHSEVRWVVPSETEDMELAPADREFARMLVTRVVR